ncbi:MAG: hypothetical protein KGQ66_09235 [Acidobacteriota bacterium]|nr:hypothetical protein [Acidobacteriota bacterium]
MSDIAAQRDTAKRLGLVWEGLTPEVQGYFEELYEAMPDKVSSVLSGAVLARDEDHPTLASWVELAMTEDGWLDKSGLSIHLEDIKFEPENPGSRESFTVTWRAVAEGHFPDRRDTVSIMTLDGAVVAEKTVDVEAVEGSSGESQVDFDGLNVGEYQARVIVNIDGGAMSANVHGTQNIMVLPLFVGQTREAQRASDYPIWGEAISLINGASLQNASFVITPEQVDPDSGSTVPAELGLDGSVFRDLAEAAEKFATMDVLADGFTKALNAASEWLKDRSYESGPVATEEQWATLRGKLIGIVTTANIDEAGTTALAFIEVFEDFAERSFMG